MSEGRRRAGTRIRAGQAPAAGALILGRLEAAEAALERGDLAGARRATEGAGRWLTLLGAGDRAAAAEGPMGEARRLIEARLIRLRSAAEVHLTACRERLAGLRRQRRLAGESERGGGAGGSWLDRQA